MVRRGVAHDGTGQGAGERLVDRCGQLPGAELTFPFGFATAVFKVGGRMFALFGGDDPVTDPGRLSVKCDPEVAEALVREYAAVTPGYHLNKRHWVTVDLAGDLAGDLPPGLVDDLLLGSYDLVVARLPRDRRP